MIEFVTLFLGVLGHGIQPIELMADDAVAAVEVWLDGERVERLERPPWRLEVDLGDELAPHVLEAVALDDADRELDRTRQWVNLAPKPARAAVLIDGSRSGDGAIARVSWESLARDAEPRSATVIFDGQPLEVDELRTIPLPPHDPEALHHLRVELQFSDSLVSEAEVTFGGVYGDRVSSELTALPVVVEKNKGPRSAAEIQGWFSVGDERLGVHALEKGLAEILVVRDLAAQPYIDRLAANRSMQLPHLRVRKDSRIRMISTCPEPIRRQGYRHLVFPRSPLFDRDDGGLLRILTRATPAGCTPAEQQLADAVAVAGLAANESGSRRVVVLVTTSEPSDRSQYQPAQVVAFLRHLQVPLVVWNPVEGSDRVGPWGSPVEVSSQTRLTAAWGAVQARLARQRIVWLEGLHLPQSVALHPQARGLSLFP